MKNNLITKNFGILGVGISNKAVLEYFIANKYKFIIWDDNKSSLENLIEELKNKHNTDISQFIINPDDNQWLEIDYLIMSPGIPLSHPKPHKLVNIAKSASAKIICDIELFYLLYPHNKYIGITSTNGKSTITSLTHHILSKITDKAIIAGNIGTPIFSLKFPKNKIIVLEISSYQIDLLDKTRFYISSLSNITPDHIDRHGSFENYTNIKYKLISEFNNGVSIIDIDSSITNALYLKLKKEKKDIIPVSTQTVLERGISIIGKNLKDNHINQTFTIPENKFLIGDHNAQNMAISYAISSCLTKISESILIDALSSFEGLKHRMQFIAKYKNITFINDSKATNAESTSYALKSYKNIYWILGGIPKENGITPLVSLFKNVKHAFVIGEATTEFSRVLEKHNVPFSSNGNLENAFNEAIKLALKESIEINILLSPACASFDQWKNFEERGNAFIKLATDFIENRKK